MLSAFDEGRRGASLDLENPDAPKKTDTAFQLGLCKQINYPDHQNPLVSRLKVSYRNILEWNNSKDDADWRDSPVTLLSLCQSPSPGAVGSVCA